MSILVNSSLALQELLVRTRRKRKEREFYFLLEHLGEIYGSHLELRNVWENWASLHPFRNFAQLQFTKLNCLREKEKEDCRGFVQTSIDAFMGPGETDSRMSSVEKYSN